MVLTTSLLILTIAQSALAQVPSTPENPVYVQAVKLAKTGHMRQANELLKSNYQFDRPGVSSGPANLHCRIEVKLKNYPEAKMTSEMALKSLSLKDEDLNKLSPPDKSLLFCRAEVGVDSFVASYDSLSPSSREITKKETQHWIETLEHADYDAERVTALKTRLTALEGRKTWLRHLSLTLSIVSWEDRPNFYSNTTSQSTKAVNLTPCLGAEFSYSNSVHDYAAGACYGLGHTSVQIDDLDFDGGAKLSLLQAYGKWIRKLTPSGSGVGLQAALFNRTISAHYIDGTATSASSIGYSASIVGRLSLSKIFFELKGGTIFGDPSAVWQFGLGVPIW